MLGICAWGVCIALAGIARMARPAATALSALPQARRKTAFSSQRFQVLAGQRRKVA